MLEWAKEILKTHVLYKEPQTTKETVRLSLLCEDDAKETSCLLNT